MTELVVSVTEPDPPAVTPTPDPIAVELAETATETASDAVNTVLHVAETVDGNMSEISEQLTTISQRLDKLEAPPAVEPEPPVIPVPVPEPALSTNPNSPEGQVSDSVSVDDNTPAANAGNTSGNAGNDTNNDKPEQRGTNDAHSGSVGTERKKDRAPKQKLGWKAKLLGGSGGRR